jgi:RNA polymerase sigma-70 factor (ECF subfamily)
VLKNRELAEEALQEAYAAIWSSIGDYDEDRCKAMTWMAAIVKNKAIDSLRREGAHWAATICDPSALDAAPDLGASPQSACEHRQLISEIMRSIEALSSSQGQALKLVY